MLTGMYFVSFDSKTTSYHILFVLRKSVFIFENKIYVSYYTLYRNKHLYCTRSFINYSVNIFKNVQIYFEIDYS